MSLSSAEKDECRKPSSAWGFAGSGGFRDAATPSDQMGITARTGSRKQVCLWNTLELILRKTADNVFPENSVNGITVAFIYLKSEISEMSWCPLVDNSKLKLCIRLYIASNWKKRSNNNNKNSSFFYLKVEFISKSKVSHFNIRLLNFMPSSEVYALFFSVWMDWETLNCFHSMMTIYLCPLPPSNSPLL